ncbi:MAG: tyrosine-type recombinase/integrase [Gordonia sp. (in: high G+C Gram-positive bacteria)]|uniref:tyrosine-type recombinase/integrase n=1 Tax=Gordonia sp. (in: high G+C Gram-positive bacteria) TaxID=84139 RepID=UPI0039E3C0A6
MIAWQIPLRLVWPVMGDESLAALVDVVAGAWRESSMSEQSIVKFVDLARRFTAFAQANGVEEAADVDPALCREFIDAPGRSRCGQVGPPAVATRHQRRAVLRMLFRTARAAGIGLTDPTGDLDLPLRGPRGAVRPLDPDEVDSIRFFADRGAEHRHATTVALLLAGARTAEIGWLTVADLDLDAGAVRVHGSMKYDQRTVTLEAADLPALRARVEYLDDPDALLCAPIGGDAARRQSLIGMTVGKILQSAGLGDDETVTPTSLTATAGHRAFTRTGRIEDAARGTGCRSLDSAATLIGYRWQEAAS